MTTRTKLTRAEVGILMYLLAPDHLLPRVVALYADVLPPRILAQLREKSR